MNEITCSWDLCNIVLYNEFVNKNVLKIREELTLLLNIKCFKIIISFLRKFTRKNLT